MDIEFLTALINKFRREDVNIYIADTNARILVCSETERIGGIGNTARYIITIQHAASIQNTSSLYETASHYGTPVMVYGSIEYVVVTYGNSNHTISIGDTLQAALQTALEYHEYQQQKSIRPVDELDKIASLMLTQKSDKAKLLSLMHRHELDPHLLRAVIDINLNFYQNKFFNINLDLGYESSIEVLRSDISRNLRKSKYLNSQDLLYSPDRNTIIIIKSFIKTDNISRIYLAIEEVCKDLVKVLNQFNGLSFSIAYGNFYDHLEDIHMSWKEATEMLELGKLSGKKEFFSLDSLLLDCVSLHLLPQIKNKYMIPAAEKLKQRNGQIQLSLLETVEAFVDNGLSLTATTVQTSLHRNTVNTRLKHFTDLTGFHPADSFRDAFLTKMLALYVKREQYAKLSDSKESV